MNSFALVLLSSCMITLIAGEASNERHENRLADETQYEATLDQFPLNHDQGYETHPQLERRIHHIRRLPFAYDRIECYRGAYCAGVIIISKHNYLGTMLAIECCDRYLVRSVIFEGRCYSW